MRKRVVRLRVAKGSTVLLSNVRRVEHGTFYSTAAQVIPVLLVLGVIENRLVSRQELLRQVREMGEGVGELPFAIEGGLTAKILVFIITTPLTWVLVLLAGEAAAFLALWLGDKAILAVITGVALGYGLLLVLAGAAIQLTPAGSDEDEAD
jgi:hypothetical protein